jgi:nitroreductase/Pyruvate/2-oxoacid:ferredoxin oxidoreductase delta subunit
MPIFEINEQTCTKCGLCAADCPVNVIMQNNGGYPEPHKIAEGACLRCGHCVAICPSGSFSHREMPVETCPPVQKELLPNQEQLKQLIRSRRSIRSYLDKPVPRELLTQAIEIGRYGPTGHNNQTVNWLVIDNPIEVKRITALGFDWMGWVITNQARLASYFGFPQMVKDYENGVDKFLRNAPVVVMTHARKENSVANIDCVSAMAYFDLAARNLDLGCCWAGFLQIAATSFPPMIEALNIPENNRIYGSMMVGYQRYKYYRLPERQPPRITWR